MDLVLNPLLQILQQNFFGGGGAFFFNLFNGIILTVFVLLGVDWGRGLVGAAGQRWSGEIKKSLGFHGN